MPHSRTGARAPLAGNRAATPTKDVEAALDAHIRDAGLSFDRLGLHIGVDGETLRLMLDPDDRRVLGASRLLPLLRALGTPEPFNAAARLPGHQIAGDQHQLLPIAARASTGDVLVDVASGARECGALVEMVAVAAADGIDPLEAAVVLRSLRPHLERLHGVCAQLEAIARRSA